MADFKATKEMSVADYKEFQNDMERLSNIKWNGYAKTIKEVGVSYMLGCNSSSKLRHNLSLNMLTGGLYLASSDLSGINVCPKSDMCRESCLVGSGRAKIDALSHQGRIERARIIKTRLFFANKPVFMQLIIHEIKSMSAKAEKEGKKFSVRLNCTSDINPTAFVFEGKNILEIFPEISFYDYSKVRNRMEVAEKYANYDLTFSRDGSAENEKDCLEWLSRGGNVAVVFGTTKKEELPTTWKGYNVLYGDEYDYRPWDKLDPTKQIVGLLYKIGKNDYKEINGKNVFQGIPDCAFVVKTSDPDCK